MGYSPWGCKELDMTEPITVHPSTNFLFVNLQRVQLLSQTLGIHSQQII